MTLANASVNNQWYNKTWLVIVLCLFVLPVGMYALWKSQKISKGWKIGLTVIIGLFVVVALSDSSQAKEKGKPGGSDASTAAVAEKEAGTDKEAPAEKEEAPAEKEPAKNEKSLFDTPEDFKKAFNKYVSSNDLDFAIDEDLEVKDGEVQNVFQYMFNDHLGILGTVNKSDGSVKEITLLGTGDGSLKSGSNIILGMMAIIAAVDPNLQPEKRIDILKELGLLGGKEVDVTNLSGHAERNGIKYFISSSQMMGIMFGASRK